MVNQMAKNPCMWEFSFLTTAKSLQYEMLNRGDVIPEGIRIYDDTQEKDAVCRLDTGYFIIEMCRGTGMGEGASKWGIRHFMAKAENVDLLSSGNNAIGGFYGPFFTPENGLINPPEHVIADVDLIENGPNMSRYRLAGRIPDGLLPELQGKRFTVTFTFTVILTCSIVCTTWIISKPKLTVGAWLIESR